MKVSAKAVHLRQMGLQDLGRVVDAHLLSFPDGFFARLGRRFLIRYYRTFLDGPLAVAIVAEREGAFAGYLVGILDPPQHRQLLLTYHGLGLAVLGAVGLISRPVLLARFLGTRLVRYYRALAHGGPASSGNSGKVAILSHVVVSTRCRGVGIGTTLVEDFLSRATAASCQRAYLVTAIGPEGAGPFYDKLSWTHAGSRRGPDGRSLAHYERPLGT